VGVTLAALAMLSLGRRYSGELAGWLAASFYLLHPLINQWTRYVLTESLFYAGIILTAWFLSRSIDNNTPFSPYLWLVAAATASLRPNGILLLGAVASALVLARHHSASFTSGKP
jgi:4-amino-4-deoxy-L-arabinose transferase-like glycosyltransferase